MFDENEAEILNQFRNYLLTNNIKAARCLLRTYNVFNKLDSRRLNELFHIPKYKFTKRNNVMTMYKPIGITSGITSGRKTKLITTEDTEDTSEDEEQQSNESEDSLINEQPNSYISLFDELLRKRNCVRRCRWMKSFELLPKQHSDDSMKAQKAE